MRKNYVLWLIFLLALLVRFYSFQHNIYFGFDEARDALVAQDIYLKGDLKIIGPSATGNIGLFHGPLFWYIIGPIYLLFNGSPEAVSAVFRVINAGGVFLIFAIGSNLLNPFSGLMAALLFAVSFEETQYAMYVGNPSLGVLTNLLIFWGASQVYKKGGNVKLGVWIMFVAAAVGTQLNLMFAFSFVIVLILLLLLRKKIIGMSKMFWLTNIVAVLLILSTYIAVEFKYGFRSIKTAVSLITGGFGIMSPGESKYSLYWGKFLTMFRDNIIGLSTDIVWQRPMIAFVAIAFAIWMVISAIRDRRYAILLVWLMSWVGIMLAGGHMAYYTNVGIGVSILIGTAIILEKIGFKNLFFWLILSGIIISNILLIYDRREKGLIQAIKPQPYMNLIDEKKIVEEMYTTAHGRGFTLRLTGIPYKIQTVWYYLLNQYGYKKYGYFPYWEHGNISGFPGELPTPTHGTTCLRFLVREPMTGLPVSLVELDEKEENYYSKVIVRKEIGLFTIEERYSTAKDCHNDRP